MINRLHYLEFIVSLGVINLTLLNQFWPARPSPKGFSIEKLAKGYREKISKSSSETVENSIFNEYPKEINLKSRLIDSKVSNSNLTPMHWANRDFGEYREVA